MNQLTLRELKTLIRLVVQEELEEMICDRESELEYRRQAWRQFELEHEHRDDEAPIGKHAIPLSEMWEKLVRKFPSC